MTIRESLNSAAAHYASISGHHTYNTEDEFVVSQVQMVRDARAAYPTTHLDKPFTVEEFNAALKQLTRSKALGPDNILAECIKHAGQQWYKHLLYIFNYSWQHGVLPASWTQARVCMIAKPGKDNYKTAESFRPVAVTSVVVRLFESMIKTRLVALIDPSCSRSKLRSCNQDSGSSIQLMINC